MSARILVVDDEKLERVFIGEELRLAGYEVQTAANPYEALSLAEARPPELAVVDVCMPGMDGLSLLAELRSRWPDLEVILVTAHATVSRAVDAMKQGARDFLEKPVSSDVLLARIRKALADREVVREAGRLRDRVDAVLGPGEIVAETRVMREAVTRALAVKDHDGVLLLVGETGSGKDTLAQLVHARSARHGGPFVKVSCAALSAEVIESELFGHEAGAFTGALRRHHGCFERAHGGTLFLDDVDDVPLELQVKLLRAVEEQAFERVGGEETLRVDVRIIVATKCDLVQRMDQGRFRSDLYYRLSGLQVVLPPLRERQGDIPLLLERFLRPAGQDLSPGLSLLDSDSLRALCGYAWPGNVRELRRFCEGLGALAPAPPVGLDLVRELLPGLHQLRGGPVDVRPDGYARIPLREAVDQVEERLLRWAMERASGNQGQAADMLGIPRTTLQSKLSRVLPNDRHPRREPGNPTDPP